MNSQIYLTDTELISYINVTIAFETLCSKYVVRLNVDRAPKLGIALTVNGSMALSQRVSRNLINK